jgi:quercetin dioxygenase-like cupin family protein
VPLRPGDVLILPAGSTHRIENTSDSERMYTVTIMANDDGATLGGFAKLVNAGTAVAWDDADRAALTASE